MKEQIEEICKMINGDPPYNLKTDQAEMLIKNLTLVGVGMVLSRTMVGD